MGRPRLFRRGIAFASGVAVTPVSSVEVEVINRLALLCGPPVEPTPADDKPPVDVENPNEERSVEAAPAPIPVGEKDMEVARDGRRRVGRRAERASLEIHIVRAG